MTTRKGGDGMSYMTNAAHNRKQAARMFAAGLTPGQVVSEFPLAYKLVDGKLGLCYSAEATRALHNRDATAREFGLREQNFMVSSRHVDAAIIRKAVTA